MAQASEDLQLRLWDLRTALSKGPAMAQRAGPNQLICMDAHEVGPEKRNVHLGAGSITETAIFVHIMHHIMVFE